MHRLTNITGEKQEAQLSHRGRAMPSAGARLLEQGGHGQFLGAHGEHVEREPITGVWGQRPQRGPGAEPLVRGSGGEVPLKLKAFLLSDVQRTEQICTLCSIFSNPPQ